jgi:RNA polymerase sigma-70 factor, ECF subfamily
LTRTDAELLKAASQDPHAYREFYDRYAVWIRSWFVRHTGNEPASLDLTAETFAQAWLGRRRFRDERDGSALPWLVGIARNLLRESARRDRIETRARVKLGLPLDLAAEDGYADIEDRLSPRNALARALEELPAHELRALELRVVDELPYSDVAERLAIRPAAARLRVSRALRRLALTTPKEEL